MRGHMHNPQPIIDEQHARIGCSTQLRDVLRVPRKVLSRQNHRLLIQGGGHHRIDLAMQSKQRSCPNVFQRRPAARRAQLPGKRYTL